jgi:hypothetical protein
MKIKDTPLSNDLVKEIVEWIDGERVSLDEYELRLQKQTSDNASLFLLINNSDLNWIFGIDGQ